MGHMKYMIPTVAMAMAVAILSIYPAACSRPQPHWGGGQGQRGAGPHRGRGGPGPGRGAPAALDIERDVLAPLNLRPEQRAKVDAWMAEQRRQGDILPRRLVSYLRTILDEQQMARLEQMRPPQRR